MLKYITLEELKVFIKDNVLGDITQDNYTLVEQMEKASISEIDSYIGFKYNTTEIFNKSGDNRNTFMVTTIIDMILFHLHSRISPTDIPEIRLLRYQKAIDWLEQVSKGKLTPNLPVMDLEYNNRSGEDRFGSAPKVNNTWF